MPFCRVCVCVSKTDTPAGLRVWTFVVGWPWFEWFRHAKLLAAIQCMIVSLFQGASPFWESPHFEPSPNTQANDQLPATFPGMIVLFIYTCNMGICTDVKKTK